MNQTPYHILAVDDEPRVRQAVARVLEPQGHQVFSAANGREGLEAIGSHRPDLVLVDLMMPEMDGMEFLDAARRLHPDLAFVVITGYATLEKAVAAMKQGADDFLAKPFKPQELRLVVERVLKRVRTVQDMAVEKSRTRALINAMTNGVVVVTPEGEVAMMNPALARLLECRAGEAVGRPMREVLPCPEVLEALGSALAADREGGPAREAGPVTCQITLGEPEEPVHLQVLCEPFRDGRGHLVGAVAVFDDVTALRRLDEVKSEFVSMVAHEIASPLSSVLGQLQTLNKGVAGQLNEKQSHLARRAASRVEGIITLSKELLDLSKIEAGTLGEPAEVDLGAVVREAVDILAAQAEDKGQTVEVEIAGDLRTIQAVPRAVQEVALNLVSNAVKYTPEGGRVSVAARNAADGVELVVSDTGFGIPAADQEKVFQRFYRVKDAQTRHIVGTGLGLPIVKQVVEGHGGSIRLDSQPGRGSTFAVRLPARPPQEPAAA